MTRVCGRIRGEQCIDDGVCSGENFFDIVLHRLRVDTHMSGAASIFGNARGVNHGILCHRRQRFVSRYHCSNIRIDGNSSSLMESSIHFIGALNVGGL